MRLGNKGLAVDSGAEVNGRWVKGPEEWGAVRLLVCGVESPAYRSAARARKVDRLTQDQRDVAIAELVADHVLIGWEGIVDEQGNNVPFSRDICRGVLLNRDNRRLVDFVLSCALDLRTFDPETAADDAKN